jgi:DNA-binding NarL/FixJ family response regulator
MRISTATKPMLHVALVESDPLRSVGFLALLESKSDLELISASLPEIAIEPNIDVVLIGHRFGQSLSDTMFYLKRLRPNLPIMVTGPRISDEIMLKVIVCGGKGYVFDGAPPREFARALRVVSQGSVWAPRRILSMFIDLAVKQRIFDGTNGATTDRDQQVLRVLVKKLPNKAAGAPLGIVPDRVKAHLTKIMRKVRVHNRAGLSVHTVTRSLV